MGAQKAPRQRMPWIETPLTESVALSKAAGCNEPLHDLSLSQSTPPHLPVKDRLLNRRSRIFLKHDYLQPSGSFKSRGLGAYMLAALDRASDPSAVHFYCSSGGNAGLACVHAANALGRPSTVVVPTATKDFMVAKLRSAGARVVKQHGSAWFEADTHLRSEVIPAAAARGEEPVYVMPFDHPDIWAGHTTIVDELRYQLEEHEGRPCAPDVIVCSSGGGGLFNGICIGVERHRWDEAGTQILVMGTEGADALWHSLQQGENVRLDKITSKATSLGCSKVSEKAFELASTRPYVYAARLTDQEAAMGCWRLADDERIMVELACGVNVALCYGGRLEQALGRKPRKDEIVVIEVCGGSSVTVDMLSEWKREYGYLSDTLTVKEMATVPSAVPS